MARINRTNVIQKAVNDLALSTSADKIPTETLDKVQLVYSLNNQNANVARAVAFTTTQAASNTFWTTSTTKEFFLTNCAISLSKDATCDTAAGNLTITAVIDGISRNVLALSKITLTAESNSISLDFTMPIKIDKGTNIQITPFTFTVGTASVAASIIGIEIPFSNNQG